MIPKTVAEICELFDARVCTDLAIYQKKEQPCFYIGQPSDISAGLFGFQLTPAFFSKKALERYCRSKKGHVEINMEAAKIFSDWDAEKECWND